MPRCGCQDSCACLIVAGDGVTVEGIGTLERPYEIASESGTLDTRLLFTDDGGVDFTAIGAGTPTAPLVVSASAALSTLSDVPPDAPTDGQVLVWRTDHWEYEDQSGPSGAGPSGVWGTAPLDAVTYGTDSLVGDEIYVDSNGQVRSRPQQISGLIADRPVTALCTAYPKGTSVMYVSAADGAAWPTGTACVVMTTKTGNNAAIQWCALTGNATKVWIRNGYSAAWGPWVMSANGTTPHISRNKTTSQNLTTAGTYYTITFEEDMTPPVGITYSGGVFTVPDDGIYQLNANILFGGTQAVQTRLSVTITDPGQTAVNVGNPAWNSQGTSVVNFCRAIRMKAGATLYISAYSNTAGNNVTGSSTNYTTMSLTKIAP